MRGGKAQGSTDGIGKELAKQLAKKGFNIVLVGRTPSKLSAAKAEVSRPFPIKYSPRRNSSLFPPSSASVFVRLLLEAIASNTPNELFLHHMQSAPSSPQTHTPVLTARHPPSP